MLEAFMPFVDFCCVKFAENTNGRNVAFNKRAIQISTWKSDIASRAVDNDLNTVACTRKLYTTQPWWAVDLNAPMDVARVTITNDANPVVG